MHALKITFIILAALINPLLNSKTEAAAQNAVRSAYFVGPSFQYEALSVSTNGKVYNGLLYGLVFGRDFVLSKNWGMSLSLGIHGGSMVNQAQSSDQSRVFSPSFGLGLNYSIFSGNIITSYHYFSNNTGLAESLGLKGEGLVHWIVGKNFEFQVGGSMGQTGYFSKASTSLGLILRMVWFFKGD